MEMKYLRNGLLISLFPLAFYGCNTNSAQNNGCKNDYECPGEQVCIDNYCTLESKGLCSKDNDCSGELVCVNKKCVNYQKASYNGMPEGVFKGFTDALSSGDLEKSLEYFDPMIRNKYSGLLKSKGLENIAGKLDGKSLISSYEGENFREYNIVIDNEELPIQFVRMYENGNEVWKIREF